jgi:hypothetical protein
VANTPSVDQQLEWEARHRPRAAAAAIAGALLTLASNIISGLTLTDAPGVSVIKTLQRAIEPGAVTTQTSLRVPTYEYLDDNSLALLAGAVCNALGFLCFAFVLTYVAFATRARRPEFPKAAAYAGLIGGVLYGVFSLFAQIAQQLAISDFLNGPRTVEAAEDIGSGGLLFFAQILYIPAVLALGMGFVFIGLNAMRAGLLTRFMGVLGIMLGVFLVLPLLPYGATLIQVFWFGALGLLLANRWPGGMPPAWRSGEAEPWPKARDIRDARAAARAAAAPPAQPVSEPPEQADPAAKPHPVSKKRKRKRRS